MRVVAFQGSPRKGGNTELLLGEAVAGAGGEARVFDLNAVELIPCQNCGGCEESGVCILQDDMNAIYKALREADRIILASPIYFMGLSAQAKAMVDRCQAFWCEKYLLGKPIPAGPEGRKGLLLLVGGMKKEQGVRCAEASATAFFRSISVPEHRTLSYLGVDAKGEIRKHPTALRDARRAGEELVR
ncbi:MAG: flavodoxin family protein [Nitrospirota bacterium]